MEIKIMPIDRLLQMQGLHDTHETAILFITLRPNYYDFGYWTPFFILDIADIETPILNGTHLKTIKYILEHHTEIDILYVCCDAGISRSPAIAYFIAKKLGYIERAKEIEQKYRFKNERLIDKLEGVEW